MLESGTMKTNKIQIPPSTELILYKKDNNINYFTQTLIETWEMEQTGFTEKVFCAGKSELGREQPCR